MMTGKPATGLNVRLSKLVDKKDWVEIGAGITNSDGRILDLLAPNTRLKEGSYRLRFETGLYFKSIGLDTFYPQVEITFQLEDVHSHTHVPLLLSAFGYTTYRGS
jgi:5-hydroxyisourate hydrolase